MSQTYSTMNRDMAAGRVYSTQRAGGSAAPPVPRRPARQPVLPRAQAPAATPPQAQAPTATPPQAQAPTATPPRRFTFPLTCADLPAASQAFPGVSGTVTLEGRPGEPYRVDGQISGLPPAPDPAIGPALWLIHDLTVPTDLAPADLATLPAGASGTGNRPGTVFTFDGNPATYGPNANTLSVVVSPGRLTPVGANTWRLQAVLSPERNQGFHPLFFAGPEALVDMNAGVSSGTLATMLTDLFMRPATVHPDLPLQSRYLDRLKGIAARHLGTGRSSVLDGAGFTRAAVTLEGLLRAIPTLMPTRESCILQGGVREES